MTPASSDRYQSRLFRFVYKQSRRFTQQCDRAWRNLQSTASWLAAVGLYPLFLLLQSRRSTANQVNQAVEETLRQLPAEEESIQEESPTADTPIRQVLLYVTGVAESQKAIKSQKLGVVEAGLARIPVLKQIVLQKSEVRSQKSEVFRATTNYQLPTTNYQLPITTHPVQGIASQLSSRSLVLVTAQNQTLDVLAPQQQQALQEEIIAAVAQYWQYRRRQNQSLAPAPLPLVPSPWLTSIDHSVAEVESHHLVRVKSAAIAFYQSIFSPSSELSRADRPVSEVRAQGSGKTHTTKILSLIWAAIDYFFGGVRATSPMTTGSRNQAPHLTGTIPANPKFPATRHMVRLPAGNNSAVEDLEDPWLSASDLFGSGAKTNDPPNPPYKEGQQSTPPSSKLQDHAGEKILLPRSRREMRKLGSGKRILPPLSRGVGRIGSGAKSAVVRATAKGKQSLQQAEASKISNLAASNSSVQPTPDWIETPAILMGYVKHPLEQMLAWLDRAMLWLEETLLKFWQWMQKIWRKF